MKDAQIGTARWFNEAIAEGVDQLWELLEHMGETLLAEADKGYAPGVEPDDTLSRITAKQLREMPPEQASEVLQAMAMDPRTEARAARMAAEYLEGRAYG